MIESHSLRGHPGAFTRQGVGEAVKGELRLRPFQGLEVLRNARERHPLRGYRSCTGHKDAQKVNSRPRLTSPRRAAGAHTASARVLEPFSASVWENVREHFFRVYANSTSSPKLEFHTENPGSLPSIKMAVTASSPRARAHARAPAGACSPSIL